MDEFTKLKERIDKLTRKIDSEPTNEQVYFELGKCYYEISSYGELGSSYSTAISNFNKVIELNPGNTRAYQYRGWCYMALNNQIYPPQDKECTKELQGIKELTLKIEIEPENVANYFNRGRFYLQTNQYMKAFKDFNKVVELGFDSIVNEVGLEIIELLKSELQGYYEATKSHVDAIQMYTQVIQNNPENAAAYKDRGIYHFDTKSYVEAFEDFLRAIELDPQDLHYWDIAEKFFFSGHYTEAVQLHDKLIADNPDNAVAYYGGLFCLQVVNDINAGLYDFRKAIAIDPKYEDAYYFLGTCYIIRKEYARAIEVYTTFSKLDLTWNFEEDPIEERAYCYEFNKEYGNAVQDYTTVMASGSGYHSEDYFYLHRSFCYYHNRQERNALEDLSKVAKSIHTLRDYSDGGTSIISSEDFIDVVERSTMMFFWEVMSMLFNLNALDIDFCDDCKHKAELWDRFTNASLSENEYREYFYSNRSVPDYHILQKELLRDGCELWLLRRKSELLEEIAKIFSQKHFTSSLDRIDTKKIAQESELRGVYDNIRKRIQKKYEELVDKKESGNELLSISELIELDESTILEFKSSLQWDTRQGQMSKELRHEVLKTIAAFLNTEGGTLLIGMTDNNTIYGLEHDFATLSRHKDRDGFEQLLMNLVSEHLGVNMTKFIQIRFEVIQSKEVCAVTVKKAPAPVFMKGKKGKEFYIRAGNGSRSLDIEEALKYIQLYSKGIK